MATVSSSSHLIVFSWCHGTFSLFQAGRGSPLFLYAFDPAHHCLCYFHWISSRPAAHLRSSFLCASPGGFRCRLDYWHYLAYRRFREPVPFPLQSRRHERGDSIVLSGCVLHGSVFQFVLCGSSELDQHFPSWQRLTRVVVPLDADRA